MRRHDLAPDTANHEVFFAPVELEGFAQFKVQRNVGFDYRLTTVLPPIPGELSDSAVVTIKTSRL